MLSDWIHWLSWRHTDQLLAFLWALLLIDSPRYALSKGLLLLDDLGQAAWQWLRGAPASEACRYCPSVCVILAGYNEEDNVDIALRSVWGTYPRLEIIVVDDGSLDATGRRAREFGRGNPGVLVLDRPERGGKSSADNFALAYTRAEVIVIMDTDSQLGPDAIWEIVQPLRDPAVGGVSASVLVRDPFHNLVTWFQAYEYLQTIFHGRMVAARVGMLGIISGAFGAFRRTVLDHGMGNDVGPDEDTDLTLRIRKFGWKIAFAPHALCYTDVPPTWGSLVKQRLLWDEGALVRYHCRKHADMVYFWSSNFRWRDFFFLLESWFFHIIFQIGIWIWIVWFCWKLPPDWGKILLTLYFCYLVFEIAQFLPLFYYSRNWRRDALICCLVPLVPFYHVFIFLVRSAAVVSETLFRSSADHNYVPARVRRATWRW